MYLGLVPEPTCIPNVMATSELSQSYLKAIQNRRTIYSLSDKPILPDAQIVQLIQQAVREAPSSFNVQSSRVVVLLGDQHDHYWNLSLIHI